MDRTSHGGFLGTLVAAVAAVIPPLICGSLRRLRTGLSRQWPSR